MTMVYQFKWKPGVVIPVDAQQAGEELERIRVRHNGRLEADMVVDKARDPSNPLHPAFEWDDSKAAEKYRLRQAGDIIRGIAVTVERPEEPPALVRAFVHVEREGDHSYTSVHHAMSDAELRRQVIARAFKELHDWRKRHEELVEFAEVFSVIDSFPTERE